MSTIPALESPPASDTFAGLYERNADRIYAFCRRRLKTRQEAEDAVQETFLSAMRSIKRGTVPVHESAWLHKIAENACFAVYRSGARRHARDLTDSERMARLAAPERRGDALLGLDEALGALPSNQRNAFVLRELRGLSYKEIAFQLGVSVAAVETLIYRARRGLAQALETGAGVRGRLTASLNAGSLAASLKGWLAGAWAVKAASAAAVVAVASMAAAAPPQQQRQQAPRTEAPAAKVRPAAVQESVLWGGARRGRVVTSTRPEAGGRSRAAEPPRPRPEPRQPRPVNAGEAPPTSGAATPEVLPMVAPAKPLETGPVPAVNPVSKPPVATPSVPQLPAIPPVVIPDVPLPVVQLPAAPELPTVPIQVPVPDVGDLLPEAPLLP